MERGAAGSPKPLITQNNASRTHKFQDQNRSQQSMQCTGINAFGNAGFRKGKERERERCADVGSCQYCVVPGKEEGTASLLKSWANETGEEEDCCGRDETSCHRCERELKKTFAYEEF